MQAYTYSLAFSIFNLLSLTSFSSSSKRAFCFSYCFLHISILSSPALIRARISVALFSMSSLYFVSLLIYFSNIYLFFRASSVFFLFSFTRFKVVSRIATFFWMSLSKSWYSCLEILKLSLNRITFSFYFDRCSFYISWIWLMISFLFLSSSIKWAAIEFNSFCFFYFCSSKVLLLLVAPLSISLS